MSNFLVWGNAAGEITAAISFHLQRLCHEAAPWVLQEDPAWKQSLIIFPPVCPPPSIWEGGFRCRILLLPESCHQVPPRAEANYVITYGLSPRNCITVSSMDKRRMLLSVQRELPTLTGCTLERQEIPLVFSSPASPESRLAVGAALLLLGVPPELLGG